MSVCSAGNEAAANLIAEEKMSSSFHLVAPLAPAVTSIPETNSTQAKQTTDATPLQQEVAQESKVVPHHAQTVAAKLRKFTKQLPQKSDSSKVSGLHTGTGSGSNSGSNSDSDQNDGSDKENRKPASFDEILEQATSATLICLIRQKGQVPAALTVPQRKRVRELLAQYHEDLLLESPLIDARGKPIALHRNKTASGKRSQPIWLAQQLEFPRKENSSAHENAEESRLGKVDLLLENYASHRAWQKEHLAISRISPKHAVDGNKESDQEQGVIALSDIPAGEAIVLGGMLIEEPQDCEIDKKIRQLAGCDKFYSNPTPVLVEAMDISMKIGTAHFPNLRLVSIPLVRADNGKPLRLDFLFTNRLIKKGEQLCYAHVMSDPRQLPR